MSESQAFFLLSVLCDRILPGYYSTTMYGTLLDQKVFESLVEKTMPVLWEHLVKSDVQLRPFLTLVPLIVYQLDAACVCFPCAGRSSSKGPRSSSGLDWPPYGSMERNY
jgi:hypothetical protein